MTPASLALHQPLAAPVHRGTGRQGVSLSPHCLAPSQDITSTGPGKGVLESTHPAPWPGPLWTSLLALSKPLRLAMMTPLSGLQVSLSFSGGGGLLFGDWHLHFRKISSVGASEAAQASQPTPVLGTRGWCLQAGCHAHSAQAPSRWAEPHGHQERPWPLHTWLTPTGV